MSSRELRSEQNNTASKAQGENFNGAIVQWAQFYDLSMELWTRVLIHWHVTKVVIQYSVWLLLHVYTGYMIFNSSQDSSHWTVYASL